jgi:hypothetical protein
MATFLNGHEVGLWWIVQRKYDGEGNLVEDRIAVELQPAWGFTPEQVAAAIYMEAWGSNHVEQVRLLDADGNLMVSWTEEVPSE